MSPPLEEAFDVVIVGSGPSGSAYARVVADHWPAARILMLEAGPAVSDPPGHHLSNMRDAARREAAQISSQGPMRATRYAPITDEEQRERLAGRYDAAMLRRPGLFAIGGGALDGEEFPAAHAASNVGGMGAQWFGACPQPSDSERPGFIQRSAMDDALSTAERLLRVSNTPFAGSASAARVERVLGDLFDAGRPADRLVQAMPMALVRGPDGLLRSGPDVILGDLVTSGAARFELRAETVCRRVLIEDGRAVGVECRSARSGSLVRIGAGTVVVAADAMHTPQLLFASGVRPKALGRFLNEHPLISIMAELAEAPHGATGGPGRGGGLIADPSALQRVLGVTVVPYLGDAFPYEVEVTQLAPDASPEGADDETRPLLNIHLYAHSDIRFENGVDFSDTRVDWCDRPAMRMRYVMSEDDRQTLELGKALLRRITRALGRALPGHHPRLAPPGSSLHYQGTVRMGAVDDGGSVCDRHSRVWGVDNLYVAGNGVIPTRTAGNPTLFSVALAVLGARHIARGRAAT